MKQQKIVMILAFIAFAIKLTAQLPPQTVVFKVRKAQPTQELAFLNVEESATFQGGDLNDFRNWVQQNVMYRSLCPFSNNKNRQSEFLVNRPTIKNARFPFRRAQNNTLGFFIY